MMAEQRRLRRRGASQSGGVTCAGQVVPVGRQVLRRRRSFWGCRHSSTVTTITAGMAREVCEECGDVSVRFVDSAVRLHQDIDESWASPDLAGPQLEVEHREPIAFEARVIFEESSRFLECRLCSQPAAFTIPDGLMCDEHAWQAAARIDWDTVDPWVPIRIDRSTERR